MFKSYEESLEMFFASLDEKVTEELITIFEDGDESKLGSYLETLSCNIPKSEIFHYLTVIKEMKGMFRELN